VRTGLVLAVLLCQVALSTGPAFAGPPFRTDDPEPVDLHHWEIYGFTAGTHLRGDTSGTLAGLEVNYGAATGLQLHIIAPLSFDRSAGSASQAGLGDIEIGVKYRFIAPGDDDWYPQIGTFPLLEIPSGDARRGLGGGNLTAFLPIWIQKDFGKWTTYGGGGYWVHPGPGNRDYWFAGWLLQYQVAPSLALGTEVFHQTADSVDGGETTGFSFEGIYDFSEHYHLLFSSGRGLQHPASANLASWYLAIQSTF